MLNKDLIDFMQKVHNGEKVRFRSILNDKISDIYSYFNDEVELQLQHLNNHNYEIYYVVNAGGYRDEEITRYNAVFIDLDRGKNEFKEYYPLKEVDRYKKKKRKQLRGFPLNPSYIIETRNGLHVYWLLEAGATEDQFKQCQELLIDYFDADPVVKNPARLLRVPSFYWCKDKNNTFEIMIKEANRSRYDIDDILDKLTKTEDWDKRVNNRKKCSKLLSIVDTPIPKASKTAETPTGSKGTKYRDIDKIKLIKEQDVEVLKSILKPEGIKVSSHEEVYDYLKKQNLKEFLGLGGTNFNCIFHEENKPSAGIITSQETGHYIYNCLSGNCDVSLTIIQVTQRLTGLSMTDTLRFLRKVYNVEYFETAWQQRRYKILEENQQFLISKEIEVLYPEVNKCIKNYVPILCSIHQLCIEFLQTENFTDNRGNPIFFASTRYIAQRCDKDKRRISDVVSLLVYLGLLRKVPENEIPDFLLKNSKHEAAKKKRHHIVSYYSIPQYEELALQFCKNKVKEFKESEFTMRGWGRELILRKLGEEEANRVFPQMQGKKIHESEITKLIEEITLSLIKEKEWTTESEVLDHLLYETSEKKTLCKKKIKRIVPEMLDKYGLTKKKLNKALKDELNVTLENYPNIIYREFSTIESEEAHIAQ
ncbi:hypothetical protein [Bacillus sp. N1-1]|uniref:hypothetical protein n=1 Tax=Bacillus sp. N1-1 TaxID=2682541 RepID=UPI001316F217|nr:hypothetical protein [Bacillus sp. N1-1]QHA92253.1 hypothetical protein GNK04_12900 [Bacillus sp. N1-1]